MNNPEFCTKVTATAQLLEKKHTILILAILIKDGEQYFMEMLRKLETDKKTLSDRLKLLCSVGLVQKNNEVIGKVHKTCYSITKNGAQFLPVMQALYDFSCQIEFQHA